MELFLLWMAFTVLMGLIVLLPIALIEIIEKRRAHD